MRGESNAGHPFDREIAMILLEHRTDVDHCVDVFAGTCVFSYRRVAIVFEKIAQPSEWGVGGGWIACSGKRDNPESSIRFDDVAEMDRLAVREPDDRRGMKARADGEPLGQVLVVVFSGQERWGVVGRGTGGITSAPDEIVSRLGRVCRFTVFVRRREHCRPFAVEVDQLLRDGAPFGGVGVKERIRAPARAEPRPISIRD